MRPNTLKMMIINTNPRIINRKNINLMKTINLVWEINIYKIIMVRLKSISTSLKFSIMMSINSITNKTTLTNISIKKN